MSHLQQTEYSSGHYGLIFDEYGHQNTLALCFTVGEASTYSDRTFALRQKKGHAELSRLYQLAGEAEYAHTWSTARGIVPYMDVVLGEMESRRYVEDAKAVLRIGFHSRMTFSTAAANELRAMALHAYTKVWGREVRFLRAEMHRIWLASEMKPFSLEQ